MKKFLSLVVMVVLTVVVIAQSPQKMSYQCVVRNSSGELVVNQDVNLIISILQGTPTGTVVYQETYDPNPETNDNGLLSIELGNGTPVAGSLSTIDWASGPYYLKTEIDPTGGTNYTIVGTSQLLSVPYAIYAEKSGDAFSKDYNDLFNKPTNLGYFTNDVGYISEYTESDPIFLAHPASEITTSDISNWITAYGWGDHTAAGYQPLIVAGTTAQYWRGDKTWQELNKASVGLDNVENIQLSTWTGSSNLSTVGTITEGIWNAGAITSNGSITANVLIKTGGTSSQFLKADGSVDENNYITEIIEVTDEFTATSGQTNFTLTHAPSSTSKVKMYINGIRISNAAYSVTDDILTYVASENGSYILEDGDRIQFDYSY